MATALPGARMRPHVKAHKCTALARRQLEHGHIGFTCATPRELIGLARAGLRDDLLLANESVDHDRLRAMAQLDARRHGRGRLRGDGRCRGTRGRPRGARRRRRRPPTLWLPTRRRGSPRGARPRRRSRRARRHGLRRPRRRARGPRGAHGEDRRDRWRCCSPRTRSSAATSSRAAAPERSTSTRGRRRSRPGATRSWTRRTARSGCRSAARCTSSRPSSR